MKEMTRKEFLKLTGASTALLAMSHIIPTSAYADTSKIDAPSAGMYILKNALDLYHGKVLSSADGEHWLIQFSTKYHLSYMGAVSELLKQLDSLHSYDLLNQYAMKSLTIAPDNPKAYCWLIRSLKAQGMNELATNELAAAKEHLTTEEYEEILAFGANW